MIWCVEDDPGIWDIEVYALTSAGLEAQGFADGSAFWDALQKKQPELVWLDVMLPGVGGLELFYRQAYEQPASEQPDSGRERRSGKRIGFFS